MTLQRHKLGKPPSLHERVSSAKASQACVWVEVVLISIVNQILADEIGQLHAFSQVSSNL